MIREDHLSSYSLLKYPTAAFTGKTKIPSTDIMHLTWETDQSNMTCVSTGAEQIATFCREGLHRQKRGATGMGAVGMTVDSVL